MFKNFFFFCSNSKIELLSHWQKIFFFSIFVRPFCFIRATRTIDNWSIKMTMIIIQVFFLSTINEFNSKKSASVFENTGIKYFTYTLYNNLYILYIIYSRDPSNKKKIWAKCVVTRVLECAFTHTIYCCK